MAKKNSLSYYAAQLRDAGDRRIARLKASLESKNATTRSKRWAQEHIDRIQELKTATRRYTEEGKLDRSKTDAAVGAAMTRLAKAINEVQPRYTIEGDPFIVTQQQLNLASVKKPSIYTKDEVQTFYRATQNLWQVAGVGKHERNEAIMDKVNAERRARGVSELSFQEFVDFVLKAEEEGLTLQNIDPSEPMDDETRERFEKAQQRDHDDHERDSKEIMGPLVLSDVRNSIEAMFSLPKPMALFGDES